VVGAINSMSANGSLACRVSNATTAAEFAPQAVSLEEAIAAQQLSFCLPRPRRSACAFYG